MATLKVKGTLEIGKVVMDDWEIKPESSHMEFGYKEETVASVRAHEVPKAMPMHPVADVPPKPTRKVKVIHRHIPSAESS